MSPVATDVARSMAIIRQFWFFVITPVVHMCAEVRGVSLFYYKVLS